MTPQRRAVYMAMQELGHASVDMVIEKLREHNPEITVSTVYRILDSFLKAGILSSVCNPDDGRNYYDITTAEHHHLFDGPQIADYNDPELTELIRNHLKCKLPADTYINKIQVQIIIIHPKHE